jgi:hypothetical protein
MPRWGYLSDKIITAYPKHCINNPLFTPISKIDITTTIRAFVNDSNCVMFHKNNNKDEIVEILQINTQLWEELLHQIGGKLEIPKCKFCIITWDFDKHGTGKMKLEIQQTTISINDSENQTQQQIQEIATNDPYKLLGVATCVNGNTEP